METTQKPENRKPEADRGPLTEATLKANRLAADICTVEAKTHSNLTVHSVQPSTELPTEMFSTDNLQSEKMQCDPEVQKDKKRLNKTEVHVSQNEWRGQEHTEKSEEQQSEIREEHQNETREHQQNEAIVEQQNESNLPDFSGPLYAEECMEFQSCKPTGSITFAIDYDGEKPLTLNQRNLVRQLYAEQGGTGVALYPIKFYEWLEVGVNYNTKDIPKGVRPYWTELYKIYYWLSIGGKQLQTNNDMDLAVVLEGYPYTKMTRQQAEELYECLRPSNMSKSVKFLDIKYERCAMIFTCSNLATKIWLQYAVSKLNPWYYGILEVGPADIVVHGIKFVFSLTAYLRTKGSVEILRLIEKQNIGISTRNWCIIERTALFITVWVDNETISTLRARRLKLKLSGLQLEFMPIVNVTKLKLALNLITVPAALSLQKRVAQLPGKDAEQPPEKGAAQSPEKGTLQPQGKGATLPPGMGVVQPTEKGTSQHQGKGATLPPGMGVVQPTEKGTSQHQGKGATLRPGMGVAQLSCKGAMQPPGMGAVQPPGKGAVQPPVKGVARPPVKSVAWTPGKIVVQPPCKGAAKPTEKGTSQPQGKGATLPPGMGAAQQPCKGAVQHPGKGAVQSPCKGAAQPPKKSVALPPSMGAVLPPGKGGAQTPGMGAGHPPGKGVVLPPGNGVAQQPVKGAALPPGKLAAQPLCMGETEPPGMGAAQAPGIGAVQPQGISAVQPLGTDANQPPGMGVVEPPCMGASEPPGMGSVEPPSMGATQPTEMGAAQPSGMGAAQPPSMGAAQPPVIGSVQPPGMGVASQPFQKSIVQPIQECARQKVMAWVPNKNLQVLNANYEVSANQKTSNAKSTCKKKHQKPHQSNLVVVAPIGIADEMSAVSDQPYSQGYASGFTESLEGRSQYVVPNPVDIYGTVSSVECQPQAYMCSNPQQFSEHINWTSPGPHFPQSEFTHLHYQAHGGGSGWPTGPQESSFGVQSHNQSLELSNSGICNTRPPSSYQTFSNLDPYEVNTRQSEEFIAAMITGSPLPSILHGKSPAVHSIKSNEGIYNNKKSRKTQCKSNLITCMEFKPAYKGKEREKHSPTASGRKRRSSTPPTFSESKSRKLCSLESDNGRYAGKYSLKTVPKNHNESSLMICRERKSIDTHQIESDKGKKRDRSSLIVGRKRLRSPTPRTFPKSKSKTSHSVVSDNNSCPERKLQSTGWKRHNDSNLLNYSERNREVLHSVEFDKGRKTVLESKPKTVQSKKLSKECADMDVPPANEAVLKESSHYKFLEKVARPCKKTESCKKIVPQPQTPDERKVKGSSLSPFSQTTSKTLSLAESNKQTLADPNPSTTRETTVRDSSLSQLIEDSTNPGSTGNSTKIMFTDTGPTNSCERTLIGSNLPQFLKKGDHTSCSIKTHGNLEPPTTDVTATKGLRLSQLLQAAAKPWGPRKLNEHKFVGLEPVTSDDAGCKDLRVTQSAERVPSSGSSTGSGNLQYTDLPASADGQEHIKGPSLLELLEKLAKPWKPRKPHT